MKTLAEIENLFTAFTAKPSPTDAPAPKAPSAPAPTPTAPAEASTGPKTDAPALSAEALASSRSVSLPNRAGKETGLQFIPTPAPVAAFVAESLSLSRFTTLDPCAGDGALLAPIPAYYRVGAEIDQTLIDQAKDRKRPYQAVQGDLQALYPVLRLSPLRFSRIVCNPPFGLKWQQGSVNNGQPASSTRIAFEMCLGLLASGGQGGFVCGTNRLDDEILSVPALAKAVYAVLDAGTLFPGVSLPCSLVFFADPKSRETAGGLRAAYDGSAAQIEAVRQARDSYFGYLTAADAVRVNTLNDDLRAVRAEHARRKALADGSAQGYDLALVAGKLRVKLSPLAHQGLGRAGSAYHETGYQTLRAVEGLHGKPAAYFSQNGREWKWLSRVLADGLLTLPAGDADTLAAAVEDGRRDACPLYPLRPQQRLGYVEDLNALACTEGDPAKGFVAGRAYPVTVGSEIASRDRREVKTDEDGTPVEHTFVAEAKILRVTLTNDAGTQVVLKENKDDLEYLLAHFDVPDPGDVAAKFPARMETARAALRGIEAESLTPRGYALKEFQREDLSRLLVKGGGLLAWEQGCGKSVGALSFASALAAQGETDGNALFVCPQDLVPQWQREAVKFFGREMEHVTTRPQARQIAQEIRKGTRAPGWYITHYEALALAGTQGSVTLATEDGPKAKTLKAAKTAQGRIVLPVRDVSTRTTSTPVPGRWEGDTWVEAHTRQDQEVLTTKDLCPACWNKKTATGSGDGWDGYHCAKCGYTHAALALQTLAHELKRAFRRGVVVVDEGTKIKGDSQQAAAVLSLHARRKLLLSGTPQKNYVNDLFQLLGWCCGFGTARFPYPRFGGKNSFEKDFCVIEHKLGDAGRKKILPEVTNLSMLWRLLSGCAVRRRKEDTGEALVPITFVPVTVPFGEAQRGLYAAWLSGFASWYRDTHPDAKGDVERFAACLGQLPKLNWASTLPAGDADASYWGIEGVSDWTPKTLKALELAAHHAAQGEKVLIGSDVMLTGRLLAGALNAKGIPAGHILEGEGAQTKTKSPAKRAGVIHDFQNGETRVLCAGVQSIALGHNLDAASVMIMDGLPWDYATLHQFLARAHRLTSTRPVTVYVLLTAGSLDERKWELLSSKQASADLALDGELSSREQESVTMQEVLAELIAKGMPADEGAQTVKEADCRARWEAQAFTLKPLLRPLTAGKAAPDAAPAPAPNAQKAEKAASRPAKASQPTEPKARTATPAPAKTPEPAIPVGPSWLDDFALALVEAAPKKAARPAFQTQTDGGLFASCG